MITIVQGLVGDGKSYHVAKLVVDHLLAGGVVATNMTLHLDRISRNFSRRVNARQYIRIAAADSPFEIPRGDFRGRGRRRVMVVLDEALNWFASSSGAKDERKATWGEWLRQSDKLGQDVFFIAQAFDRAAKWIRELSQVLISIKNLRNATLLHIPLGKWFGFRRIYAATKVDVRAGVVCGWGVYLIESRVWECYETAELYGFPASGNAYEGLVVPPAFRLPVWPLVLAGFVVLVGWCLV